VQLCTAAAAAESSGEFDSASSAATSSSSSGTSTPRQSKPYTPRPLNPTTQQQLQKHLAQLLPRPPHSTPLAPFLNLILPILQLQLQQLPPAALLALLRLSNWSGLHINDAWLDAWAGAVQRQLPGLQSETACLMVAEVLRLKQQQLPAGLMDALFIGERDEGLVRCILQLRADVWCELGLAMCGFAAVSDLAR
jgi:hypothetical protein